MEALVAARLLRFCVGMLLLWVLFYLSIRRYLVDQLRQNLFAIRDDLFDFAADKGVGFDEPSYQKLRQDLNNLIRFADRISMSRLLFAHWTITAKARARQQAEWKQWLGQVEKLSPLAKRRLVDVRVQALREVALFVFRRSLLLLLVYEAVKAAALWIEAARALTRWLPAIAEPLEAEANEFDYAACAD